MPFDIFITDAHDRAEQMVSLSLTDHGLIMRKINDHPAYPLLKECLIDYYGEHEIYINNLYNLKEEVLHLKNMFPLPNSDSLNNFVSNFLEIIDIAIDKRRSIKFVGD